MLKKFALLQPANHRAKIDPVKETATLQRSMQVTLAALLVVISIGFVTHQLALRRCT